MNENAIAEQIVDGGIGLPCRPCYELAQRGLRTVSQQPIPVVYGTIRIDTGFRADLIVEDQVIVEIKSVEVLAPVHVGASDATPSCNDRENSSSVYTSPLWHT